MRVSIAMKTNAFKRAMQTFQSKVGTSVRKTNHDMAEFIAATARANAPVSDGRLRAGIRVVHATTLEPRSTIYSTAPHAAFVEFGTGPLGSQSHLSALARQAMNDLGYHHGSRGGFPPREELLPWMRQRGIPEDMWFPIASSIRESGTRAQPYLYPAVEQNRSRITITHETAIGRIVRGTP